jgi:hypothetical protein
MKTAKICPCLYLITDMAALQEKLTTTGSGNILRQFVSKHGAASARGDWYHL